jgi:hypothetical protein
LFATLRSCCAGLDVTTPTLSPKRVSSPTLDLPSDFEFRSGRRAISHNGFHRQPFALLSERAHQRISNVRLFDYEPLAGIVVAVSVKMLDSSSMSDACQTRCAA